MKDNILTGSTGRTNFDPEDEPTYLKAIELFGDPDIKIHHKPMHKGQRGNMYSLHDYAKRANLSTFWRCFDIARAKLPTKIEKLLAKNK